MGAVPDPLAEINAKIQNNKTALSAKKSEVAGLSAQVEFLNQQIAASSANIASLANDISLKETQIKDTEAKIAFNKKNLKQLIQVLYEQEKVSSLELLVSAQNITTVMDEEDYNRSIEDKVNTTLLENRNLKTSLEAEKQDLAGKKADLEAQQASQIAQQQAQAALLSSAYQQQVALEKMVNISQQQRSSILAARAAQNRARVSSGSVISRSAGSGNSGGGRSVSAGGYPSSWANAPQDSIIDSYGFYNRECTSYAAWRWNAEGNRWFNTQPGQGDAKYWGGIARTLGYRTGYSPRPGALMVWTSGQWGHVAYVESVNSGGTVTVSHYNWYLDGTFSQNVLSVSGQLFIYPN